MRKWEFTDDKGNLVTLVSGSKVQATRAAKRVLVGKIATVKDVGPARVPSTLGRPKRGFASTGTVRRVVKKVGPNEPCPCGSEIKFKKCCMRKIPRPTPLAGIRAGGSAPWPPVERTKRTN